MSLLEITILQQLLLAERGLIDYDEEEDGVDEQEDFEGQHIHLARPLLFLHNFNVDAYTPESCKEQFRFTAPQLQQILGALQVPTIMRTDNGDKVSAMTALCMTLYRMSFPARLNRMEPIFGYSRSYLSRMITAFVKWVVLHWGQVLEWDPYRLTSAKLRGLADLCSRKSNYTCNSVFGYIDGTARKICRPTINQRAMYNGHKRFHALKYQGVVAPDGIIIHLGDPYPGNTHDYTIYQESSLPDYLDEHAFDPDGRALALYGDPAYQLDGHMLRPYAGANLTQEQQDFNEQMANQRVIIEWAFGRVTTYFSALDFPRTQRMLSSCLGSYYKCAVIFTNIHTCFNGSQINEHFGVDPPSLNEYIHPQIGQHFL